MKALQLVKYGEIKDSLSFNEVDKPIMNPTDVLIEVKAAALNPIDFKLASGAYHEIMPLALPTTVGLDVSGVVKEKGEQVGNLEVGDLVFSKVPMNQMGTVAEYVAVDSSVVLKKPGNLTFEEASGLPLIGLTTVQALEWAGIKENDRVLIHAGAGGVGSFAIQYAKAKGAYVYTTTSTGNVEMVKGFGADRVIDYKKEDYKTIATDLDIVYDTLGGNYTMEAFELVKKGGSVASIVGILDEETAKSMGMQGYKMPEELTNLVQQKGAKYKFTMMQPNNDQLNMIKSMVEDGIIKPVVDKVYKYEDGIEAYTHLTSGRAKGKIVISL
ncbi:MAG: NADP-dependent oxidoreductase [Bacteroidales bacterium]|nr:NADP-dependent oxidoreductase [Bacteroidales bacterium]